MIKFTILSTFVCCMTGLFYNSLAQTTADSSSSKVYSFKVYSFAEQMPEYKGGDKALMNFIQKNMQYPVAAKQKSIEGTVILTFLINNKGEISDIKVLRDIGGGCGDEAARIVKLMPKWVPGKQNNVDVNVQYNLPIKFNLPSTTQDSVKTFDIAQKMPQFPGGDDSLMYFIQRNLQYPSGASAKGIEGTVYVGFTVDVTGVLNDIKILKDIGVGCGEEAIRVVKLMPKWIPGMQNGNAVKVQYSLPIKFLLNAK